MRVSPGGSSSCVSGFQLNSTVIQEIVARYTERSYAIDFDRFIGCLIRLEMLFSEFPPLLVFPLLTLFPVFELFPLSVPTVPSVLSCLWLCLYVTF